MRVRVGGREGGRENRVAWDKHKGRGWVVKAKQDGSIKS